jgi:hypothetical protein
MGVSRFEWDQLGWKRSTESPEKLAGIRADETAKLKLETICFWSRLWRKMASSILHRFWRFKDQQKEGDVVHPTVPGTRPEVVGAGGDLRRKTAPRNSKAGVFNIVFVFDFFSRRRSRDVEACMGEEMECSSPWGAR